MNKSLLKKSVSGLIGVALLGASSASFAMDAEANSPSISSLEAKTIAKRFLTAQGFTSAGESQLTAVVEKAELKGDRWIVSVRTGGHLPVEKGVILVDAETGEING